MNEFIQYRSLSANKVMTEIILQTAEEEFLNKNFSLAYNWAISAKRLDPYYAFVDKYAEVYRIHWAAANKKTPSGEIDWYAVLDIKDRLWISYRMITQIYVKLAKKIDPELFCSGASAGAVKLITTAWEILSEPTTRHDYHVLAGLPPPTWEELPAIPLKLITLEEVNYAYHRQWEERQKEKTSLITINKVGCAPDRHRKGSLETKDKNVLSRQLEERSELSVSEVSGAHKQYREERPEINVEKENFEPNRHRRERREVGVEKFNCAYREERKEITDRKVSCAQKRYREERSEVILKEYDCVPKRQRVERAETTVRKISYAPKRHRVGWSN